MAGPNYYRWIVGLTEALGTDLGYIYTSSTATCPYQTGKAMKSSGLLDYHLPGQNGIWIKFVG